MKFSLDQFGIATSLACAIHCAVLPLFFTSLPLFGINVLHNHAFEYIMIGLAAVIGIAALRHGYRKHHHKALPLLLFTVGIAFLLFKEITEDSHSLVWVVPAVTLIVAAHIINYMLCRKANMCHKGDCKH